MVLAPFSALGNRPEQRSLLPMLSLLQRQAVKPAHHTPPTSSPTPREHYLTGQACQGTFLVGKEAAEILFSSLALHKNYQSWYTMALIPISKVWEREKNGRPQERRGGALWLEVKSDPTVFSVFIYLFFLFVCDSVIPEQGLDSASWPQPVSGTCSSDLQDSPQCPEVQFFFFFL